MRRLSLVALILTSSACHRTADPPAAAHETAVVTPAVAKALDPGDPASLSSAVGSRAELAPALVITPGGVTVIAWTSERPGGPDVVGVRVSRDDGATWEPAQTVSAPEGRSAGDPALASDAAGDVYLAFRGSRASDGGPSDTHVYVSRVEADAGLGVFSPPVEVSNSTRRGMTFERPTIAVTGSGNVLVTWAFASQNGDGVGIAVSADGAKWSRGVVIERIDLHTKSPYICTSPHGERAWVVYLDSEAGIRVRASDDGGSSWSPSRVATASGPDERQLIVEESAACVGEAEDVTIAYARARTAVDGGAPDAASVIVVARSADGGRSFDARKVWDAGGLNVMSPQLVREPDGAVDLAFYASGVAPEGGALRWLRASEEKGTIAASRVIRDHLRFEPLSGDATWPGATFGWRWSNGSLAAASVDNSGEAAHIVFNRVAAR